ncbi:MAG: T9SS type A sorting domain-containing protein [Taibaiella sp.]|nr:T9SS type A sorting domain-containing protein [Taibaiella sp.]
MKKIYLILLGICFSLSSYSQTFLFTPNFSGGFENGPNFALNNWTSVNGAANQWAVGNGSVNIGARGAYIGTATNFVGTNTPAINHFYRNGSLLIPAGATNAVLSFRYRQPVIDAFNDSFIVSVTPTLTPTPAAGATLSPLHNKIYVNTATAYTGYIEVGPLDLTALAGIPFRLVFTHVNDGSGPIGIPAVDSISLSYCNLTTISGLFSFCQNTTQTLTNATPGGTWSSSNPAVATVGSFTGTATVVTGVSAGTSVISYVVGSCSTTRTITINPAPAPVTGTFSVCAGSTTTLSSGPAGGFFSTSMATVANVNPTTGIVTGNSAGTANITYTISFGCNTSATVTVHATPALANVTGGGSFCASGSGVPVGLDASNPGFDYLLSDGTSTVATVPGTGAPVNFGLFTAAGTYTVSGSSPTTGCGRNMAGSAVITIASPVVPSVTINTSGSLICTGSAETFTAIPVNEGTTPAYQWYVNGSATGTGVSYAYTPVSGDIVSVTLYPGGICTLPDSATNSYTVVVTPISTPSVSISASSNPACQGSMVMFAATPSFGGPAPSYLWTKNGVNVATGSSYTYIPANGDLVYCQLTSNYACRSVDIAMSSTITMAVEVSGLTPVVNISAFPGTNISPGTTVTFTAITSGGASALAYQWLVNGIAITGATNTTYSSNTLVNGDIVTCQATNMDACKKMALKSVVITTGSTGIALPASSTAFTLSPNPNKGSFVLHGNVPVSETVTIKINNLIGQTVYEKKTSTSSGLLNEQILLQNTPAGMYMLNLNSGNKNHVMHFVVTN